jgi:outer membrane lipopolysaccharide assembly protein LptE/RlpB
MIRLLAVAAAMLLTGCALQLVQHQDHSFEMKVVTVKF